MIDRNSLMDLFQLLSFNRCIFPIKTMGNNCDHYKMNIIDVINHRVYEGTSAKLFKTKLVNCQNFKCTVSCVL